MPYIDFRDTASVTLARLLRDATIRSGIPLSIVAAIEGLDSETLQGELNRIPMSSLLRLWELLSHAKPESGTGIAVASTAPLGVLGTWDYLVTTGQTLVDSLEAAQPYHQLVTASVESFEINQDDGLTLSYRTTAADPQVSTVTHEYVLAYYLRRATEGLGRTVTPTHVSFSHPAPRDHKVLIEAFGTKNIEFDADRDAITFSTADAQAPLARADPHLGKLLRSHADLVLASSRTIPTSPMEWFRTALDAALDDGNATLSGVASRLAISTRTLQRRLAEHHTTWQNELDRLRYHKAQEMLTQGQSAIGIAARLGYADDRALRKAFHRWSGMSLSQSREH